MGAPATLRNCYITQNPFAATPAHCEEAKHIAEKSKCKGTQLQACKLLTAET